MNNSEEFMYWFAIKYPEEYKVKVKNFITWKLAMENEIND